MALRVRIFGLQKGEQEELDAILNSIEGVGDVFSRDSRQDIKPGVIYATALHVTFVIALGAAGLAKDVVSGAVKEMGKDLYIAAKARVQARLNRWKELKDAESGRERIHFVMDDVGELIVKGDQGEADRSVSVHIR